MKETKKKIAKLLADFVYLCQYSGIPLNDIDELCDILGTSRDCIPASQIKKVTYGPANILTPYELTDKELKAMQNSIFEVKPGTSLLDSIKDLLDQLRTYAPKSKKTHVLSYKRAIVARATPESIRKAPESCPNTVTDDPTPTKTDKGTDDIMSSRIISDDTLTEQEALRTACKLFAKKALPFYLGRTIDKKHIKKAVYCNCVIVIGGKRKISKKAFYINCRFTPAK